MTDFTTGTVQANGVDFRYLACGEGPLALCMHGFPDSPWTYRHLLPVLADAGYRAVAPFMRGFNNPAYQAEVIERTARTYREAQRLLTGT